MTGGACSYLGPPARAKACCSRFCETSPHVDARPRCCSTPTENTRARSSETCRWWRGTFHQLGRNPGKVTRRTCLCLGGQKKFAPLCLSVAARGWFGMRSKRRAASTRLGPIFGPLSDVGASVESPGPSQHSARLRFTTSSRRLPVTCACSARLTCRTLRCAGAWALIPSWCAPSPSKAFFTAAPVMRAFTNTTPLWVIGVHNPPRVTTENEDA